MNSSTSARFDQNTVREYLLSNMTDDKQFKRALYNEVRKIDEKMNNESHETLCMGITTSIAEVPELITFYTSLDEELREHFIHRILWDQLNHFDKFFEIFDDETVQWTPISDKSPFTAPSEEFRAVVYELHISIDKSSRDVDEFMAFPYALYMYRLILDEDNVTAAAKAWTEARVQANNYKFYRIAENWDAVKNMPIEWGLQFLEL